MDYGIIKYPRTPHIEGSRLQPGDEDLSQIPFEDIAGKYLVIEEKIDGANSAVSFDGQGNLLLQSRGHYLQGGYREKHYNLFKQWTSVHRDALWSVLGCRYIMYGEWMYTKHTVYYDRLPHYFMEFDVLDRETGRFLDTPSRYALLADFPVAHVPVLMTGILKNKEELFELLGPSKYISDQHIEHLRETARRENQDEDRICRETDTSTTMEGLYIKVEENGAVSSRVKFVRQSFLQPVEQSGSHWLERPIIPNGIVCTVSDLFAPTLCTKDGE